MTTAAAIRRNVLPPTLRISIDMVYHPGSLWMRELAHADPGRVDEAEALNRP